MKDNKLEVPAGLNHPNRLRIKRPDRLILNRRADDFPILNINKLDLISSPKIFKYPFPNNEYFGSESVRECIRFDTSNDIANRRKSQKLLPPLRPALHVSSFSPRRIQESRSTRNLETITFSANQLSKHRVIFANEESHANLILDTMQNK
jgi:hypothetical protein